jgi:hypothetical protein
MFNEIMPEFLDLARRAGDFSPKFFQTEMERLREWVDPAMGHDRGGARTIVKANNRQAIEYIVAQMKQRLRDNPSTQVEEVVLPVGSAPARGVDITTE